MVLRTLLLEETFLDLRTFLGSGTCLVGETFLG